jgi:uncharacterized Zn finger protein (UPF0148 family)
MAFKSKTKNRLLVDERQTLDAKHNNILQTFTDNKTSILSQYEELSNLNKIIKDLQAQNAKSPVLNIALQTKIWHYDDKIKLLEDEIRRIENNVDENDYMLKTGKLLSNYYKVIDDEKNIADSGNLNLNIISGVKPILKKPQNENTNSTFIINKKKNIIDWFQPISGENIFNNIGSETIGSETIRSKTIFISDNSNINIDANSENVKNIENLCDTSNTSNNTIKIAKQLENNKNKKYNKYKEKDDNIIIQNKDTIYENYMKVIDKNYININNDNVDIFDSCPKCSIEMLLNNNTGQLICPICGIMENIIVDSDKPSFKEPPKEMTSFCYKRINHLNEFLAQFQAKETTDIPEDVYNEILMEIKKERITNMVKITPDKMRILLKKIKKNDYYEHIPYIINQLNGLPAPVIAPEIEEIIRGMFKAIQIPFEKYCPFKRKNFLSYNYVMYKFFELLELDEYLNCFQLLKSRTKLHQQDEIWKNICKDLNWEFIKSL